jgi:formylglycine-generating enzyme required for sulfatase activity
MAFVHVDGGCFQMGTKAPVPADMRDKYGIKFSLSDDETPQHQVCTSPFWIGRHEVTVAQWKLVTGGTNVPEDASKPVTGVTWQQAKTFVELLSSQTGMRFRLPTEAEWEQACRASTQSDAYPINRELVGKAWYNRGDARKESVQAVGQLPPNPFGIFDMLGNAWEWTEDSYEPDAYVRHTLYDPVTRNSLPQKVIRGGSHNTEPRQVRCASRGRLVADITLPSVGFRVVRLP